MVINRFDVYLVNLDPTVGSEMKKIINAAGNSSQFSLAGANDYRARQLALQLKLVLGIWRSRVVRAERELVAR